MDNENQRIVPKIPLYAAIANYLLSIENCKKHNDSAWGDRHRALLAKLCKEHLPSGSGIDSGSQLDMTRSTSERLVFTFGFHHMNADGFYTNWTDYSVIVTPSLVHTITLRITGQDRNQLKDYLHDVFSETMKEMVDQW